MKITTWKAVFVAMNPSPLYEAISECAQLRVDRRRRALLKQLDETNGSPVSRARADWSRADRGCNQFPSGFELVGEDRGLAGSFARRSRPQESRTGGE